MKARLSRMGLQARKAESSVTSRIRLGDINKTCTLILVNIDHFRTLSHTLVPSLCFHETLGVLHDDVTLGFHELACRSSITTSGVSPSAVTEASLASGVLSRREVGSLGDCLASPGTGYLNCQCAGSNQSQCPLHLTSSQSNLASTINATHCCSSQT
jgi:hypothetical protein